MIGLSSTKEIFEFVVHENVASKHFIKVVNIYFIDVKAILEQHLTYPTSNLIKNWRINQHYSAVVEQLAERLLLTRENQGSNPAITNFYKEHLFAAIQKTKIKKKRP